jgi:hypothetical protein
MADLQVSVSNGKYTVILKENGGTEALRHGEPWRDCCGDNLIYCLASELDEARQEVESLKGEIEVMNE